MEQNENWSEYLAKSIGRRVAYYREHGTDEHGKKLTAQALADRCADLGHPLDRSVIAKLEKGHRATVTVADWLVLARALGVAPVQLLMPFGIGDPTEILPGREVDSLDAAKWISGEDRFPLPDVNSHDVVASGEYDSTSDLYEYYVDRWYLPSGAWEANGAPVILQRRHRMLLRKWQQHRAAVRAAWRRTQKEDTEEARDWVNSSQSALDLVERDLRNTRDEMRLLNIETPWIWEELAVAIGEDGEES